MHDRWCTKQEHARDDWAEAPMKLDINVASVLAERIVLYRQYPCGFV